MVGMLCEVLLKHMSESHGILLCRGIGSNLHGFPYGVGVAVAVDVEVFVPVELADVLEVPVDVDVDVGVLVAVAVLEELFDALAV